MWGDVSTRPETFVALAIAAFWLAACSPIGPIASTQREGATRAGRGGSSESAGTAAPERPPEPQTVMANVADACDREGARICENAAEPVPLLCENSLWTRLAPCAQGQRCETEAGPNVGQCVEIPPACNDGEQVCEGELIRTCRNKKLSAPEPCRPLMICSPPQRDCVCAPGSPDLGLGMGCQTPTNCDDGQGGCDPHTQCSMRNGEPVCSDCPPGYAGSGSEGCAPLLAGLTFSAGTLDPAFAPNTMRYRLQLPLLQHTVSAATRAPSDAVLTVDGKPLSEGAPWMSPVLPLGQRSIEIALTTRPGVSSRYEVALERSGAEEAFIKPTTSDEVDHFGSAIAIHEDTMVVGALFEDGGESGPTADPKNDSKPDAGAAYVYVRRGTTWMQEAYLKAESPDDNDFCGLAVAVWKDTIALGCVRSSEYGNTPGQPGEVYVFVRNAGSWTEQQRLTIAGNDVNMFGHALALEGDRLVVGAPYEDQGGAQAGAVYVYERSGDRWGEPVRLEAETPRAQTVLGWSVALSGDTIVAGAIEKVGANISANGPGAAYVYNRSAAGWSKAVKLAVPQLPTGATFGWAVAVHGNTVAVGASRADLLTYTPPGEVYIFERSGEQWGAPQRLLATFPHDSDYFGSCLALSANVLAIGAAGDFSSAQGINGDPSRNDAEATGSFYLYGREGDHWVLSAYVKAKNAIGSARLGETIAMSGDTVVSGASSDSHGALGINPRDSAATLNESGAAYVFR